MQGVSLWVEENEIWHFTCGKIHTLHHFCAASADSQWCCKSEYCVITLFLPIQRMSDVSIWRYLVFWALKNVKGPSRRVKTLCKKRETEEILHSPTGTVKISELFVQGKANAQKSALKNPSCSNWTWENPKTENDISRCIILSIQQAKGEAISIPSKER